MPCASARGRAIGAAQGRRGGRRDPRGSRGRVGVPHIEGTLEAVKFVTEPHKKKPSNRNLAQEIVRGKLDEETIADAVEVLIKALTDADKDQWAYCSGCRKKVPIPGIDAMTRVKALAELQALGWGRPKADEDEKRTGFILNRIIVKPSDNEGFVKPGEDNGV